MTYQTRSILRPDGSVRATITAQSVEELEAQLGPDETLAPPSEPEDTQND